MGQIEKIERNRDLVQLFRLSYSKYSLSKIFKVEKRNLSRILLRDYNKYPYPTESDIKNIELRNNIIVNIPTWIK